MTVKDIIESEILSKLNFIDDDERVDIIIDFVNIFTSIYIKDLTTERGKLPKPLTVKLDLINKEVWTKKVMNQIKKLVEWVSDEQYDLVVENSSATYHFQLGDIPTKNPVTLHSGGLDSLAGAHYNFQSGRKSDYVGFTNKTEETKHQQTIGDFYKQTFEEDFEVLLFSKFVKKKKHYMQATRSLLYFSAAVAKAYSNNPSENIVYMYENGPLSLNPNPLRRITTKTTHPKTIYLFNKILKDIDINIHIQHPFIFKTKGEILDVMNEDFKSQIKNTFTCGASRLGPTRDEVHFGQCGVCVPCLLRKISLAAYDNEKYDCNYFYNYDSVNNISTPHYNKLYMTNINLFKIIKQHIEDGIIHKSIVGDYPMYCSTSNITEFNDSRMKMFQTYAEEIGVYLKKYG